MVTIRLSRTGVKKRPYYHIVVTDNHSPRDGRFIERLGYFNPTPGGEEKSLYINEERIQYWLSQGAQASERVTKLYKHYQKQASAA